MAEVDFSAAQQGSDSLDAEAFKVTHAYASLQLPETA